MRRFYLILLLIAVAGTGSCSVRRASFERGPAVGHDAERPLVGYLQHRGRLYRIGDLLDPRLRAPSDDPFVREFDPDHMWAGF
ncbi:MAG: hypothetical protein ACYSUI_01645 [Planctomycetota bacterium]|jgi:hypothetical protein